MNLPEVKQKSFMLRAALEGSKTGSV